MCDVTAVTHVTVQEKRPRRCRAIFNAPQHCEYCCCCSVRPRSVVHDDGMLSGDAHAKNPSLNGWIGSEGSDDVWKELCPFDRPSPPATLTPFLKPFNIFPYLLCATYPPACARSRSAHLSDLITKIGQDGSPSRSLLPLLQEQALPEE